MWSSVEAYACDFQKPFEGLLPWLYADEEDLVTVWNGDLVDPVKLALSLVFTDKRDGHVATPDEIRAEWSLVKSLRALAKDGGGAFEHVTNLRLTPESGEKLMMDRMRADAAYLAAHFVEWGVWPADAQMGSLSMAWAAGPGVIWEFPKWSAAAHAQDWATCAGECELRPHIPGEYAARNAATVRCFLNAAVVLTENLDRSVLHYPESALTA